MAYALPPAIAALLARLQQRYRVLAPFALLALVRFVYHRRQRHLEQLRVHRAILDELTHARHVVHAPTHTLAADASGAVASEDRQAVLDAIRSPIEEWHDVTDGVQVQSLVYHALPEAGTPSNTLVLVLPGNPGIAHFYLPLMRELVQRFGRRHEVRALSNAGHFMPHKNNGRTFTFAEQIAHKIAFVGQRIAANPSLQLVIICHSIGSFIALQIAAKYPSHIAKLCLMQPTITHIGRTRKGAMLLPVFRHREVALRVLRLLELACPLAVRRALIRVAIGVHTEAVLQHATLSLVNRSVLRNVLFMALHEMEQVGALDDALVRPHEAKTLFVYSPIDDWVPNDLVQGYQTRFSDARHRVVPQSHGFMMDDNGTRDMAEHIAQWIADVMESGTVDVRA